MNDSLPILASTALFLGLTHTVIGPDHYLPFIVLGRAEKWSLKKTLLWTVVCGVGHVASSILIGALGILLGWQVAGMEEFEGMRGDLASFALLGFGGIYMLWGLYRAFKGKHGHAHVHVGGSIHMHSHDHAHAHSHQHSHDGAPEVPEARISQPKSFWAIFIIFVLGPCEPLIPLLMVPAAVHSVWGIVAVTAVFSVATLFVMVLAVTLGYLGLGVVRFNFLEKYVHALSGGAILVSGLLIQLLGI